MALNSIAQNPTSRRLEGDPGQFATSILDNLRGAGVSRQFPRPQSSKVAIKVINHYGDEVMKVFGV